MLSAGESFGEQALYESAKRTLTVRAGTDCKCLALARGDLQSIMGTKILEVIKGNWTRWAIEKDPVFKDLTKLQIEKIIMNVEFTKKQPGGEVILERGSELTKVVIVLSGSLLYTTKTFPKGTLFDSSFLYPQSNTRNTLEDDLITGSEGAELAQISISRFHAVIGKNLEEVFQNNANSHELKMLGDNLDFRKIVENLKLDDLVHIKKLGEGQFGQVFLVKGRGPNDFFALKAISKAQIVEEKLEKHTLQEKEVLEAVNFPFIMQLYRTFKDDNFVYFLLSFVRGMELFDVIRDISTRRSPDLLSNQDSQFYISSMLLAVEYLHKRKIVYRDIKPENIMIDENGYLKLIDMGTAKILKSENGICRTYTFLGTPHYMAPEIIKNKGYGLNVDLWSIGTLR